MKRDRLKCRLDTENPKWPNVESGAIETPTGTSKEIPNEDSDEADTSAKHKLKPAHRLAYLAKSFAEQKMGSQLTDREAYEWLREHGTHKAGGDLEDYDLPPEIETFFSYCSKARVATGEKKYGKRAGRTGRSVVSKGRTDRRQGRVPKSDL